MYMVEYMARPVGFEPTTNRFEVCDSIQLSYGRFFYSGNTAIGNKVEPQNRLMKISVPIYYFRPLSSRIIFRLFLSNSQSGGEVAGDMMSGFSFFELRCGVLAYLHTVTAPGIE